MMNDLTILLVLTQRENQRLASARKRLGEGVEISDIERYRRDWEVNLGFPHRKGVLEACDALIASGDTSDTLDLLIALERYTSSSWLYLKEFVGSPNAYLDDWGSVSKACKAEFKARYEKDKRMYVAEQGRLMREILAKPQYSNEARLKRHRAFLKAEGVVVPIPSKDKASRLKLVVDNDVEPEADAQSSSGLVKWVLLVVGVALVWWVFG